MSRIHPMDPITVLLHYKLIHNVDLAAKEHGMDRETFYTNALVHYIYHLKNEPVPELDRTYNRTLLDFFEG